MTEDEELETLRKLHDDFKGWLKEAFGRDIHVTNIAVINNHALFMTTMQASDLAPMFRHMADQIDSEQTRH